MRRSMFIGLLLIVPCIAGIVLLQRRLDVITGDSWKVESMTYLPQGERIRPALLGFESTVAHYLWIRTVLYFGSHLVDNRNFPWLVDMVDNITRLHPHFYPAYEFAGLILPDMCGDPASARVILERGITHLGDTKWNLHFYLGMLYYEYYKDKELAARHFMLASRVPSRHSGRLAGLAATLYSEVGNTGRAHALLQFMYETSESPDVRRHVLEKWQSLKK